MNLLSLPLAQSLRYPMPPGAVKNVSSALAEPLGDKFVKPGTLSHDRSQLHSQRALAAAGEVGAQLFRVACENGDAFAPARNRYPTKPHSCGW
jgi:hypothetical protein